MRDELIKVDNKNNLYRAATKDRYLQGVFSSTMTLKECRGYIFKKYGWQYL